MDSKADRKEAIRKYKERKPLLGTFAVRCSATGDVWVGISRNLDATKNGLWFGLRLGTYPSPGLQQVWNAQGAERFDFEILETLKGDLSPIEIPDLLKEKKQRWMAQLGARSI